MPRLSLVLLALLVLLASPAEARRRASRHPGSTDPNTPSGWLYTNARILDFDVSPIRPVVGNAVVVGLGDGSHGTHEFSAMKVRMIRYLVEQMDFDVVAIEAAFAPVNRLNAYIQGGPGDPRAILADMETRLTYFFWNTEEFLGLIEWMRAYNAQRGTESAIELIGVDTFDEVGNAADVVAYLRTVDPVAAASAESAYACVASGTGIIACRNAASGVRRALAAKEAEYVARSSPRAYHDALRAAEVMFAAAQFARERDPVMADGVLFARKYRGTSGKVVYWAHNEHVSQETDNVYDAGTRIARELGKASYAAIAMMSGPGSFFGWKPDVTNTIYTPLIAPFGAPPQDTFEWNFQQHGAHSILVPLTGALPSWLTDYGKYRYGGSDGFVVTRPIALPQHYDAVVYVSVTTPLHKL
jgi:erythromycin esterase